MAQGVDDKVGKEISTYAIRASDMEEISRLIGSLFGVTMELIESEVWDDYYTSDKSVFPYFSVKRNDNPMEDEIDFYFPEFSDYEFFLEVVYPHDMAAVHRALVNSQEIDAVLIPED